MKQGKGTVLIGVMALLGVMLAGPAVAAEYEYGWKVPRVYIPRDVAPVNNEEYKTECGACHMPYPPGFLPARSWHALMGRLDKHFGDDAELPEDQRQRLLSYMEGAAADKVREKGSTRVMQRMAPDQTPLRLTDTAYLRLRHRNVLPRFIQGNPKVKGFSDCSACHTRANEGFFNEREIQIPGFSRQQF